MRRATYLVALSVLCVVLLVSCTNPVKKDISINISLTGEAENIKYSKFSTTPASFHDNIVVNKYKVYLYQNGTVVYQQESTNVSNNTISLRLTNINSGTYTLKVEAFNDTTPIFYGEKVVQLSYGQNDIQIKTYFNKAKLTVDVENQVDGCELSELSITETLSATPTNNFVENKTFENKEIYPGVWDINLEATLTLSGNQKTVTWKNTYEIYPSEDKLLNFVVKSDDLGNVYIDLQTLRVRIVNPTNGETLHGTVTILAEVQDKERIFQVKFFANDELLKSFNFPPYEYYEYSWNTCGVIDGTYTLRARATNLSGNESSKSINVIVNNGQKMFVPGSAYSVKQTTDGGYIVAGYTTAFGAFDPDVYVLKLNSDGSLAWEKTFGGNGYDAAYSIQQTTDGGYIVAGGTDLFESGSSDAYVLKLNSDGGLAWEKTFGGSDYDVARSIQQTTDGGYIAAGYTSGDVYVLKLNSDGSLAWQKTYSRSGENQAYSIQQTTDGGYIAAGYTSGDVYVLKLNSDGSLAWQKTFGGNYEDRAYSIQQTTDGGYIVTGYTKVAYTDFFEIGNYDVYILKLNSDGSLAWQKTFGGNYEDYAYSIQQTTGGGYIVAGYTNSFGPGYYYNVYALKLNSDGSLAWQKTFGGNYEDYAYSIQQTADGGYIVAGDTWSFGAGDNVYILKLDSSGELHSFE